MWKEKKNSSIDGFYSKFPIDLVSPKQPGFRSTRQERCFCIVNLHATHRQRKVESNSALRDMTAEAWLESVEDSKLCAKMAT
jgi:hypothetical protein